MNKLIVPMLISSTLLLQGCVSEKLEATPNPNDLVFNDLALSWDEAMPLGNAFVGALVWQRDSCLRMSLDRIDVWDQRPSDSLQGDNFSYKWVEEQLDKGTYQNVQNKLDAPYDELAAPSKIPCAAMEFDISSLGKVEENRIYIDQALLEVSWVGGVKMKSFIHASEPVGWFEFDGVTKDMIPQMLTPRYNADKAAGVTGPVSGQDLRRLEYKQGEIKDDGGVVTYHQKGWGEEYYDVAIKYDYNDGKLIGVWSVSSSVSDKKDGVTSASGANSSALAQVNKAFKRGIAKDYAAHKEWWSGYWNRSAISVPDKVIEKQYYNEMYKFGSLTRENSYIIPLQGVWTADNGLLPPWKGDVHHDLNTELSYWPAYTGNMCDIGMSFLNTLYAQRDVNRAYTKKFFGVDGINVPGVATLSGEPMGGWAQYSFSPTISSWLAQHFYLHWRYTMDEKYLSEMGYPYVKDVATFIENITHINSDGFRVLPLSSSPEIFDNSSKAWFRTMTNYDLALIKYALHAASKMSEALNLSDESQHWAKIESELPDFDIDKTTGRLNFAMGKPYDQSHRHFAHAMAIHPMSIFDVTYSDKDKKVVDATIKLLDEVGPDYWTGYSYSWLANMKARALNADGARDDLKTFAECFVLRNGFHVNGDQSRSGKSLFTYRPFTLEGNFAYASALQEMMLQSHTDIVRIFPAIPDDWADVSFENLRAQGALVISAQRKEGKTTAVTIFSEKGGKFKLQNPYKGSNIEVKGAISVASLPNDIYEIDAEQGVMISVIISRR